MNQPTKSISGDVCCKTCINGHETVENAPQKRHCYLFNWIVDVDDVCQSWANKINEPKIDLKKTETADLFK